MTLFFVTDRVDAHVARFDALFKTLARDYELVRIIRSEADQPRAVVSGVQCDSWGSLRSALSVQGSVVVSGPLDTVSADLGAGDFKHVGISFATDVMVTAAQSSEELLRLKRLVSSLDAVVTDNFATENALISLVSRAQNIVRIPWGPSSSGTERSMRRAECGWPENRQIVLYPRSLEPHYDPLVFVDALTELTGRFPGLLVVFVESGSLVGELKQRIAEKGLSNHAHFEPMSEPEAFRSKMGCADVLVVSPRTDGTSVTVMDAMALGVPVVSSLTPGSGEWVIDGITGWTFPVGNASALATAIEKVLVADSADRKLIIENAKRLVKHKAGWDSSSERIGQVLRGLLS